MRFINIRDDMFYGTSEKELERLDFLNDGLLFVKDAKMAYMVAERESRENSSLEVIIHISNGSFLVDLENNCKSSYNVFLGESGNEARKLGLARLHGYGEVRIYRGAGMAGLDYFKTVFL